MNNCELACRYTSRNVISTTVQMSEMPDHTKSIEKQCNEFNMGYIIMNEVAAELVRNLNASCFGRSRISDELINKMIKSGKTKLTHEENQIAASPRFKGNQVENILNHFFPEGKFHLGQLSEVVNKFWDDSYMARYKIESRLDRKNQPKADGTVANDLRSVMSLCDVLAVKYYACTSVKAMLEYMCKWLNKLSNNLVRDQRRKKQRKKALDSIDHLIPEDAIIKYMTHPTVMMVHSDLLHPNFRQDIANGMKYTDLNIYLMSRHLAMSLLIRNVKRPVVISSLRCKDMDDAIIKRSIEQRKPGVKRDQPVYLCVAGKYAQTGFKTVVVSSMSVEVDRWQMLLNFYLVRQTFHGASGTDTLFCSLRRKSITNFGQQVVKAAWVGYQPQKKN